MSGPARGERFELPKGVLAVRRGPGANCSSIGSVVDVLFGAAVFGSVIWAGILASLKDRPMESIGAATSDPKTSPTTKSATAETEGEP